VKSKGSQRTAEKECGSENVSIEMVQVGGKTKKSGNGIGGHANNMARGITAMCTLGMSNLVWKKSKGGEKTKTKNEKACLCQNCAKMGFYLLTCLYLLVYYPFI